MIVTIAVTAASARADDEAGLPTVVTEDLDWTDSIVSATSDADAIVDAEGAADSAGTPEAEADAEAEFDAALADTDEPEGRDPESRNWYNPPPPYYPVPDFPTTQSFGGWEKLLPEGSHYRDVYGQIFRLIGGEWKVLGPWELKQLDDRKRDIDPLGPGRHWGMVVPLAPRYWPKYPDPIPLEGPVNAG
ncbi:MAG TPA: hypothetical protein VEL07_13685 [Planctomycetota bacterium]|nr:hypothetical protein [Planctomycetota bacterium]